MTEARTSDGTAGLDRLIHEPARLLIMTHLAAVKDADFVYLLRVTGLTKGNLSTHLTRLEAAEYVGISKGFDGKTPRTVCRLTPAGRAAMKAYARVMQDLLAP